MLKKESSLKEKIWSYLIIFSCLILISLWLFQVIFLNSYYEWSKKRDLRKIVNEITEDYKNDTLLNNLDNISFEKGICIQIIKDGEVEYGSGNFNHGCMMMEEPKDKNHKELNNKSEIDDFKQSFITSNKNIESVNLVDSKFNNKTIIYGVKLDDNVYAFISASLSPMDATMKILASQLIIVTIGVLILSLVIGYIISKMISKPIIKINEEARKMANKDYNANFDTKNNIKELNELASTLNYTNQELANTEELRREILANISHDLKTPLTMIKAYAEMVRDLTYKDEKKRTNNLNVIIDEANRLNLLVNDILELSKMQSNIDSLTITEFDITNLVNTIVKRFEILTETEDYKFITVQKKKIMVLGDIKKIEQVIYNLISNAINYTGDDKKVEITVKELDNKVRVSIKDTGNGIKKEQLDKIWDKYYKSNKKHKRNAYGTGIGLSIVKEILEKHNSKYGVTSKEGRGTTFYFELDKK